MRQKPRTRNSHGEKVVKDIRRATRKRYSAEVEVSDAMKRVFTQERGRIAKEFAGPFNPARITDKRG